MLDQEKAKTVDVSRGGRWPFVWLQVVAGAIQGAPEAEGSGFSYKYFQTTHFAKNKIIIIIFWTVFR